MSIWEISNNTIVISAIVSFVVSLLTIVVTHALNVRKLYYEQRLSLMKEITEIKYPAINEIRNHLVRLKEFERFDITEDELRGLLKDYSLECPSIFYSREELTLYTKELDSLIGRYGHCMSDKCYVPLVVFKNYLFDCVVSFYKLKLKDETMRTLSVLIQSDLRLYHMTVDRLLIEALNKPTFRYYYHSGMLYEIRLKMHSNAMKKTSLYQSTFGVGGIMTIANSLSMVDEQKEQ